jgi:selenide,water dikinase
MASQAGTSFRFELAQLPWLPGAVEYGAQGAFPGGMGNNMRFFSEYVRFGENVSLLMQDMLFTPETSGGLLASLAPENVDSFLSACPQSTVVGQVIAGPGLIIVE